MTPAGRQQNWGETFPLLSWETVAPFLASPFPKVSSVPCSDMSLLLRACWGRWGLGVCYGWAAARHGTEGLWDA